MIRHPTRTFETDRMKNEARKPLKISKKIYQNLSPTIEGKQTKVRV
jgi:hypothetical protein